MEFLAILVFGLIFKVFLQFEYGRNLLLKHPKVFTFGLISHEGPTEETMNKNKFSVTFFGKGWPIDECVEHGTKLDDIEPTKCIITKVTGTNPGYGATCVAVLLAAETIINESDKIPLR